MIAREARALVAGALGLGVAGLFVALRLEVTTDITHFLPGGRLDEDVRIAKELTGSELSRTMILLVDADDTDTALRAGRAFEEALRAEPRVAAAAEGLLGGPPPGTEEALWELYHPRRFAFLAPDPEAVAARTTSAALREAAVSLKERLALPVSSLLSRVAPEDPTLVLPALFERLEGGGNGLVVVDGRFTTTDGRAAALLLTTRASSTDSTAQLSLLAGVQAAWERVAAGFDGPLRLSASGANRFAVRAEQAIQADIRRVSLGSTAGLALLLLVLFRSLRLVLLVLPVVAAGFLAGTVACLVLFGSVHGLTLAFGAAMIGVSIDYAVHFHCHQTLAPHPDGPRRTLAGIWRGLALGAATTIAGFVALLASSFPGLRELAVFAGAGILGALLATRVFLPGLAVRRAPPRVTRALVRGLAGLFERRGRARYLLHAPVLAVALLALSGLPRLRWNDSIAELNRLDPALLAEDEAVRGRVTRFEQSRMVLALGDDTEAALRANDRVAAVLTDAREEGLLGGFRSLATLLPSARRQRAVDARVRADEGLWARLRAALAAEGFVPERFEPFRDALAAPPPTPLALEDLLASPLAPLARPFVVTLGSQVGVVSFLRELDDPEGLAARLAGIEGARLVDVQGVLTAAYGEYRERMTGLSLAGLVAVLALVALRHRAVRPTLVACAPALLAAAGTVGALSLLGVELNVLSLVALLMVVSMGVDYGVFLAESGDDSAALEATRLAVVVAGTSTLLGFGLLAFSDQPPLHSIGITAGLGVSLCFVLAPLLHALLAKRPA